MVKWRGVRLLGGIEPKLARGMDALDGWMEPKMEHWRESALVGGTE